MLPNSESQSPPRNQALPAQESPIYANRVHHISSYQNYRTDDARRAVLEDLGATIPQVSLQDFIAHLAPPQPHFDLEATIEALKADPEGLLPPDSRWKGFDVDPKDQNGTEDTIFQPLPEIFNKVVEKITANSALATDNCLVEFLHNPTMAPTSVERHNMTRPDGYLVLKDRDKKLVSWADVLLSCEYKPKDGPKYLDDDVRKCLWSMQHIMREDPCHRATFGMTIENTTMRVWFCCRSSVIVSEGFNFISEPTALVKLFAAFAFADKSSLGLDPTIERIQGQETQYIISVHPHNDQCNPRRFLTKKIISSYGAEPLRGRGTRVFTASEIDERGHAKGPEVVVKDLWIDDDRMREGAFLTQLYDEADEEGKKLVKKHFLTTICHGDVWVKSGVIDDTKNSLMRSLELPMSEFHLQQKHLSIPELASGSTACITSRLSLQEPNRTYGPKTHYRIVFKEFGYTIDLVSRYHDIIKTLLDTVTALQLLRRFGWAHRDISIGNILVCKEGPKLSDLEYMKKIEFGKGVENTKCHETRTGTLHFMSVEVAAKSYLFKPEPGAIFDIKKFGNRTTVTNATDPNVSVPWAHNYLHDLESLWWVATWIAFLHDFCMPGDESPADFKLVEAQLMQAKKIFPATFESTTRQNFFMGTSDNFLSMCHKAPHRVQTFRLLDEVRKHLIYCYRKVESTLPRWLELKACNEDMYTGFTQAFNVMLQTIPDYALVFLPQALDMTRTTLKRPRPESISTEEALQEIL